jgi:hypothetical protein
MNQGDDERFTDFVRAHSGSLFRTAYLMTGDYQRRDAEVDEHSYLVRCSTNDGACELVFDLGANSSRRVLYMPDWEKDWGFARYPDLVT